MMDNEIITISDLRRAGFCAPGIYGLAKSKGWTKDKFRQFIRDGETVGELRKMGENALLDRVIEVKRRVEDGGRG
jgi:hypothetical protein